MLTFSRRASLFWLLVALFFAIGLSLAPATMMGGRLLLVGHAARAILGLAVPSLWIGWAVGWLLLPSRWKSYELLLMPLVGIAVLVPASYFLNYLVDMRMATVILMLAAAPPALLRLRRRPSTHISPPETVIPIVAALGLLLLAIVPHLVQGSLAMLSRNFDEETYYYLARYLQSFPAGAAMLGPASPVLAQGTDYFRAEGWGYQYLLALASAASGVNTLEAYLPTSYLLLAFGVPAWYLFFREVLLLPRRWSAVGVVLYSAHGLSLWFASYGYARQTAWIALTPMVVASIFMVLKIGGLKPTLLAGLSIASLVAMESRVGITEMVMIATGLAVYWLLIERRPGFILRLGGVAIVAATAAAPALWYFARFYLVSGGGVSILKAGPERMANWGPQMQGFPPIQVALGLEPEAIVKIAEPIPLLSWLDPLNLAMSASSGYFAYPLLLLAALGAYFIGRKNPLAVALTAGFFVWMGVTRVVLQFPYGYFKLFGVVGPLMLGFAIVGAFHLRDLPAARRVFMLPSWMRGRWLVLGCLLLAIFFVRNTAYSFLFSARGWGLSIPPALMERISSLEDTEPGARVYVTSNARYPVPEDRYLIRKDHHEAMQSKEEASMAWSTRIHAMAWTSLVGREIYGVFKTFYWQWSRVLPDDGYDYYLLYSDEDPRCRGLDRSDIITEGDGIALYRAPTNARTSAEQILAGRGTLRLDGGNPLVVSASVDGFSFGESPVGASVSGQGRVRLGLLALKEMTVDVRAGSLNRRLALDPGLSWYTTPTLSLPATIRVDAAEGELLRVVALRSLSPGAEDMDRSGDSIVSSEIVADGGGVNVDLWLSNPMKDAKGATANLSVSGDANTESRLSMDEARGGERWLLSFPAGGGPVQLGESAEMAKGVRLPWIESGGPLSLVFRLGREIPREVLLGSLARLADGKIQLDRYVDPVQQPLWGSDDRPKEKQPPDLSALEGALVRAEGGLTYLVQGGRRHWIADAADAGVYGSPLLISPEQLWLIPPGLPLAVR